MRNLFALIGILVVGVGGLGWYLGWYKVNVTKNSDGEIKIQTDVDTKKVSGDSSAFFQKVGQVVNEKVQEASQNNASAPATTPASTPGSATPGNPLLNNPLLGNGSTNPANNPSSIPLPKQMP
jgi:hypothetical protein